MFTPDQTAQLQAKLAANVVRRNPRGFDYVEGWHAIAEANRIFGHEGWDRNTVQMTMIVPPWQDAKSLHRVSYMARVTITVRAGEHYIARDGYGYGDGIDRDPGRAHESAIKEAETDAMKRALMTFGNPFGLALYDKARSNVDGPAISQQAAPSSPSSYAAKRNGLGPRAAELMHEIAALESPAACTTWTNARGDEIRAFPQGWQNELQDAMDAQWKLVGGTALAEVTA